MSSSDDEVYGWEKDEYKELSDSEVSNISYTDSEDEQTQKKKKKKKISTQDPKGENIPKTKIEYSTILQEETDYLPE